MEPIELRNILSSSFDFDKWKTILGLIFSKIEYFTKEVVIENSLIKSGGQVGNIRLDDGRSLAIFKFDVADNIVISRNRKGLRDITAHYVDQSLIHGAWVFYYSQNQKDYRLTYIAKQTDFTPDGELVKSETAPKRYTFLLGENEKCTTAASRLYELITQKKKGTVYLTDVTEAFSVERLNKEFFKGYKAQYNNFLAFRNKESKDDRDYIKKLLGRLVFLQFLQKKGWMGVPAVNESWSGGDKNYLSNLVDRCNGNDRLLSDVLNKLFFETLNEKRSNEKRSNDIADPILGDNIKIPYLNGGLFDKDRLDYLNIDFPYVYFKDLMSFFSMYNFTIDENDPDDAEVGIDPEMLGHIFENLLEDNKDKGAFYTPKEIVQYMSRESIMQYLKTYTDETLHNSIEILVKSGIVREELQSKEIAIKINDLLKKIKVCDPAIGSGAFPMGVLNVLFHCRQVLYGFTQDNNAFSPAEIKREIIQENIYGVDIEQGAVDIARLRFWLALVVDELYPQPLPNLDYKIMCGNSLLNRYDLKMHIDDVFKEYNKGKTEEDKMTLARYKMLVADYTNTSDHTEKDHFRIIIEEIKRAFRTGLRDKLLSLSSISNLKKLVSNLENPILFRERTQKEKDDLKKIRIQVAKQTQEYADIESNKFYDGAFEWRFEFPWLLDHNGDFMGFDIIIGNPPYIKEATDKSVFFKLKKSTYYQGKMDFWYFFACLGIELLSPNGHLCFIATNNWVTNDGASKLRAKIISETKIIQLIDFYDSRIFETANIQTMIMLFQKNFSEDNYSFDYRRVCAGSKDKTHAIKLLQKKNDAQNIYLNPIIIRENLKNKILTFSMSKIEGILGIIEKEGKFHFNDIKNCPNEVTSGIDVLQDYVNKKSQEILNNDSKVGDGIFVLNNDEYKGLNLFDIEKEIVKPYYTTKQLGRYYGNSQNSEWIIYTGSDINNKILLYPNIKTHLDIYSKVITSVNKPYGLHRARVQNNFEGTKILALRKCANRPVFTYVDFDSYVSRAFLIIKTERVNMKYLTGLLNSELICFWLKNRGKMQGANFQIDKGPLLRIPIKIVSESIQKAISSIVDYVIFTKQNSIPISDLVSNSFISDYFERIIDGCIYELYFPEHMREKEINILDDVVNRIIPIDNLTTIEEKKNTIWNIFSSIKKTDNPIRSRLELFATRSPEILKLIIER